MIVVATAIERQDGRETEASGGDRGRLTIDHLDATLKRTPTPPVAITEQEKERTDILGIEETSESGIETGVTGDKRETVGEMTRKDHLEENGTYLMIEGVADEEGETARRFREVVVGIERKAQPHHQRRRSLLRT
jgi:hypothetical protein